MKPEDAMAFAIPDAAYSILMDEETTKATQLVLMRVLIEVQHGHFESFPSYMIGLTDALAMMRDIPELASRILEDIERDQNRVNPELTIARETFTNWVLETSPDFDLSEYVELKLMRNKGDGTFEEAKKN